MVRGWSLRRQRQCFVPLVALALALGALLSPAPAAAAEYRVQPGENLSVIAARHGLSWRALWRLNPQLADPNRLRAGMIIDVPDDSQPTPPPAPSPAPSPAGPVVLPGMARPALGAQYTVQPGDSLGRIAQRHGLTWAELWLLNPQLTRPERLRPGDVVRLPAWPASGRMTASVTAYAPTGRRTASGKVPQPGMAASNTLSFGTVVRTSTGLRVVVEDRIGCCSDLDIFLPTTAEARRFGRQRMMISW